MGEQSASTDQNVKNPISGWVAVVLVIALGFGAVVAVSLTRSPGSSVVVEALWFGETADGSTVGGVTPVEITALVEQGDAPFSLDLSGIEVAGAGPMWTAATTTAAAQAVLDSGLDPRTGELNYALDEAIDGPSAGALMTVGSLAAINNTRVASDITMTGTVLPDGSVGAVGGVPEKIRAAAEAGFDRVLVPADSTAEFSSTSGDYLSPVAIGEQVGVEVTSVASIRQAYDIMTEQNTVAPEVAAPPIDQSILDLLAAKAAALNSSTQKQLKALEKASSSVAGSTLVIEEISNLIKQSEAMIASDQVLAFSAAAEAAQAAVQLQAAEQVSAQVAQTSLASAVTQVRDQAQTTKAKIIADLQRNSGLELTKVEQLPAMSDALSWGTFALTSMNVVLQRLDGVSNEADLQEVVRFMETGKFESDTYMTTSVEAAMLTGNRLLDNVDEAVALLDSYADLLDFSADANVEYAASVNYGGRDRGYLGALIDEADALTDSVPTQIPGLAGPTAATTLRTGAALQDYVSTSFLVDDLTVSSSQADDVAPNLAPIKDRERQRRQAETANGIANRQAALLASESLDPSYATWMNQWGSDLALGRLVGESDEQRLHGLDTQWFGVLQTRLLVGLDGLSNSQG